MAKIPKSQAKLNELGLMARKNFDETEKQRQLYRETEWLENLRQYKGLYDPEPESKIQTGNPGTFK